ncbi:MAG: hypothetical protein JW814_12480 [Candidatus Krumholzibacteriota bacterium]|nr:hypothetical protein [Candidatus Krumholzibacteriota bacterium]
MKNNLCRTVVTILVVGAFISAQQVYAGSVFQEKGMIDLKELTIPEAPSSSTYGLSFSPSSGDSIEVMQIEIEEKNKSNIYRELAVAAVVTAFAAYIIVTVFFPEEEKAEEETGGKDLPTAGLSIAF